jgi:hypothetical protein
MDSKVTHPIDRLTAADSIATLLSRLDLARLPEREAVAVREVQKKAIEDWLAAYGALKRGGEKATASHAA